LYFYVAVSLERGDAFISCSSACIPVSPRLCFSRRHSAFRVLLVESTHPLVTGTSLSPFFVTGIQFPVHSFNPYQLYFWLSPVGDLISCPLFLFLFVVSENPRKDHQFVAQRISHWKRRILLRFGLHSSSLFIYTHTHPTF
jgi:hypothetical protein